MIGDTINNDSPEAIKADIERKRSEMSEKINTIQDRLSPDNIKVQAQEAIRDVVNSSSEAVSSYVRENSQQMVRNMATTMRRNPLPTALIGLGLGWLLVETFGGNDESGAARRYGSRSSEGRSGGYSRGPAERVGYPAAYSGAYDSGYSSYGQTQYGKTQYGSEYGAQYGAPYGSRPYGDYSGSYGRQVGDGGESEGLTDKAKQLAAEARDRVGDFTETVGDKVSELTGQVGDKLGDLTGQTRERAGQMGERLGSTTGDVRARAELYGEEARYRAGQFSEQASQRVQQAGEYVGEQAAYASEQARRAAQRTGQMVQRTYYETPVWYGAVALAVGAVAGLLLPSTKLEDEWLGETRDRFMTEAEAMAEDAARRAQQVVEQVKPELEQAAQRIVSDVKDTTQQAAEQVRSTGAEALSSVKETVRSGAQDIAHAGSPSSTANAGGARSSSQYTGSSSR